MDDMKFPTLHYFELIKPKHYFITVILSTMNKRVFLLVTIIAAALIKKRDTGLNTYQEKKSRLNSLIEVLVM